MPGSKWEKKRGGRFVCALLLLQRTHGTADRTWLAWWILPLGRRVVVHVHIPGLWGTVFPTSKSWNERVLTKVTLDQCEHVYMPAGALLPITVLSDHYKTPSSQLPCRKRESWSSHLPFWLFRGLSEGLVSLYLLGGLMDPEYSRSWGPLWRAGPIKLHWSDESSIKYIKQSGVTHVNQDGCQSAMTLLFKRETT